MKVFIFFALLVAIFAQVRLIKFNEKDAPVQMTAQEVENLTTLKHNGQEVRFFDVTETIDLEKGSVPEVSALPTTLRFENEVNKVLNQVSEANMNNTILKLSSFFTRHYQTDTSVQAAEWLKSEYEKYISQIQDPERRKRFSVKFFPHSWKQPSIIVRVEGLSARVKDEIVVIGGHIDSTAGSATRRSPGADDDASGSSTVLEAFRVYAASSFNNDRTIEFHGYAAEEAGLLGSQAIAQKYKQDQKKVYAMLQLDMTGFNPPQNQNKVGIITDFVDAGLTQIVRQLFVKYGGLQTGDTRCGYACSDHASFTRAGYRSAFPFEVHQFGMINRAIHTANDLINLLDMKRATGFTKAAVGFAVELSKQ